MTSDPYLPEGATTAQTNAGLMGQLSIGRDEETEETSDFLEPEYLERD